MVLQALVGEVAPAKRPWLSQGTFPSGLQFWSFQDADKYTRVSRRPFIKQLGLPLGFVRSSSTGSASILSNRSSSHGSTTPALPHGHSTESTAEEKGPSHPGSGHGADLGKKTSGNDRIKDAPASKACQKIWEEKCFKWQSADAHEDGEVLVLSMPREHMEGDDMEE